MSSAPPQLEVEHTLEELILIVALALVSVVTIFANLLVIGAFCIDKRLRKTNNYFVISLTMTGFLLGGYAIPLYCVTKWTRKEPFSSLSLCQLCAFLDNSLATISLWTLAMTSLDRYLMVINYKRYKQLVTKTRAKLILVFVWVYGAAVCAPPLLGWNEYWFNKKTGTCGIRYFYEGPGREFFLFYFFSSFPLPLILVTFSYLRIFIQAWGVYKRRERRQSEAYSRSVKNKKISNNTVPTTEKINGSFLISHVGCGANGNSNGSGNSRNSSGNSSNSMTRKLYRKISRQNSTVGGMTIDKTVRATLMVFVLNLTYFICTFPVFVFSLVLYFDIEVGKQIPALTYTIVLFLFFLNNALNPIMYGIFNTNFRGSFNRLLRCQCLQTIKQNTTYSQLVRRFSRNTTSNGSMLRNNTVQTPVHSPEGLAARQLTEEGEDPLQQQLHFKDTRPIIRIHIINTSSSATSSN